MCVAGDNNQISKIYIFCKHLVVHTAISHWKRTTN